MQRLKSAVATGVLIAAAGGAVWALASGGSQDAQAASEPRSAAGTSITVQTGDPGAVVPTQADAKPVIRPIPDGQWRRIVKTGTWRPGCPVGREELRRLEIGYIDFDGQPQRGVLVAHRDSVDDLASILSDLYDAKFPIARMKPVERYGGDVSRSLQANNTSAFNCRKPDQINAPVLKSPHANGRAIDINPVQNPWTDPRCDCWVPSRRYADATTGPGVIRKGSLPVRLFRERGWIWQNIKVPDYMHFDTGYPSRPRTTPTSG